MGIKNPLYNKMGRLDWNMFFSIFGVVLALLAFMVFGFIAETMWAGSFTYVGVFAGSLVAALIYGNIFNLVAMIVAVALVEHKEFYMLTIALGAGPMLVCLEMLITERESPLKKIIMSVTERKQFGETF